MYNFKCDKCSESLEAPESLFGSSIACPNCGYDQLVKRPPSKSPPVSRSTRRRDPFGHAEAFASVCIFFLTVIGLFTIYISLMSCRGYSYHIMSTTLEQLLATQQAGDTLITGTILLAISIIATLLLRIIYYLKILINKQ